MQQRKAEKVLFKRFFIKRDTPILCVRIFLRLVPYSTKTKANQKVGGYGRVILVLYAKIYS